MYKRRTSTCSFWSPSWPPWAIHNVNAWLFRGWISQHHDHHGWSVKPATARANWGDLRIWGFEVANSWSNSSWRPHWWLPARALSSGKSCGVSGNTIDLRRPWRKSHWNLDISGHIWIGSSQVHNRQWIWCTKVLKVGEESTNPWHWADHPNYWVTSVLMKLLTPVTNQLQVVGSNCLLAALIKKHPLLLVYIVYKSWIPSRKEHPFSGY